MQTHTLFLYKERFLLFYEQPHETDALKPPKAPFEFKHTTPNERLTPKQLQDATLKEAQEIAHIEDKMEEEGYSNLYHLLKSHASLEDQFTVLQQLTSTEDAPRLITNITSISQLASTDMQALINTILAKRNILRRNIDLYEKESFLATINALTMGKKVDMALIVQDVQKLAKTDKSFSSYKNITLVQLAIMGKTELEQIRAIAIKQVHIAKITAVHKKLIHLKNGDFYDNLHLDYRILVIEMQEVASYHKDLKNWSQMDIGRLASMQSDDLINYVIRAENVLKELQPEH